MWKNWDILLNLLYFSSDISGCCSSNYKFFFRLLQSLQYRHCVWIVWLQVMHSTVVLERRGNKTEKSVTQIFQFYTVCKLFSCKETLKRLAWECLTAMAPFQPPYDLIKRKLLQQPPTKHSILKRYWGNIFLLKVKATNVFNNLREKLNKYN